MERADLRRILINFQIPGDFIDVTPYGSGHIHDTYVSRFMTVNGVSRYIHQRINQKVFHEPEKLMRNIERVTAHLRRKIIAVGGDAERETLNLIPALDGKCFHRSDNGSYWRTFAFIEGARTYDTVENRNMVYEVGYAFGKFQHLMADLLGEPLHETIPDFHNTPKRFQMFVQSLEKDVVNRARSVTKEIEFVKNRAHEVSLVLDLFKQGKIPERIAHNDTKFNNVMIDDQTKKALCVIDLDTVMPGLSTYDFGDSVRMGASTAAEDERDLSKVSLDLEMFNGLACGYLDACRTFLTSSEMDYLPFASKLMTFECGMRFLTDYLDGDIYFKIKRENHNLDRCRTQFKMVEDMEQKMKRMIEIVKRYS